MRRTLVAVAFVVCLAATGTAAAETGVVDGVEYDEEFGFEGELTDEELELVVSRAMARVEVIRDRQFEERPTVESLEGDEAEDELEVEVERNEQGDWNDVVWKALLTVGEDEYANQVIADTFGGATQGFYEPDSGNESDAHAHGGRIVIVDGVDEGTLAHELVHVMQDQRYNLTAESFTPPVQDEQLASDGIVEGEAEYVKYLYEERCATGWDCYDETTSSGESAPLDTNFGVLMTAFQPYSDGPEYVHRLHEEGGWDAVDEKYDDVPTTTREIIHHEEYDRVEIDYEDEARGNWTTFDGVGIDGYDVAGEASIFMAFWYQSHSSGYGLDVIDTTGFFEQSGEYDVYTYRSDVSEGWTGDRIYPYYRGNDTNNTGFVWKSVWETQEDAERFARAYLEVLDGHDATVLDEATRTVEGDFRGAYRVARDGTNVTVVHAPTVDGLDQLRPSVTDAEKPFVEAIDARPAPEPASGYTGIVLIAAFVVSLLGATAARRT